MRNKIQTAQKQSRAERKESGFRLQIIYNNLDPNTYKTKYNESCFATSFFSRVCCVFQRRFGVDIRLLLHPSSQSRDHPLHGFKLHDRNYQTAAQVKNKIKPLTLKYYISKKCKKQIRFQRYSRDINCTFFFFLVARSSITRFKKR